MIQDTSNDKEDSTTNNEALQSTPSAESPVIAESIPKPTETSKENTEKPKQTEKPQTQNRKKFIQSCKEYKYKDLARKPDKYIGKPIKIKVQISQIMNEGWFDDSTSYRCYTGGEYGYYEDEFVVIDMREDKEDPKLLVDDIITVYGEFAGTEELQRALTGTTDEIPEINMKYVVLHEDEE